MITFKDFLNENLDFAKMPVGHPEPFVRPDSGQEVSQHTDGTRSIISNGDELDIHSPRGRRASSLGDIRAMFARGLSHGMDYLQRNPDKSLSFTASTKTHQRLYDRFYKYMNKQGKQHPVHKQYKLGRSLFGQVYTLKKRSP